MRRQSRSYHLVRREKDARAFPHNDSLLETNAVVQFLVANRNEVVYLETVGVGQARENCFWRVNSRFQPEVIEFLDKRDRIYAMLEHENKFYIVHEDPVLDTVVLSEIGNRENRLVLCDFEEFEANGCLISVAISEGILGILYEKAAVFYKGPPFVLNSEEVIRVPIYRVDEMMAMGHDLTAMVWDEWLTVMPTPFTPPKLPVHFEVWLREDPKLLPKEATPLSVELSQTRSLLAVGFSDGTVLLWDTRHVFGDPCLLKAAHGGGARLLAFSDCSNELYVARNMDSSEVPWIESFDLTDMRSRDRLSMPQIMIMAGTQRYLDYSALWPAGQTEFALPCNADGLESSDLLFTLRKTAMHVECMKIMGNKLVVNLSGAILFIDIPKRSLAPTLAVF